jgi:hypothetical protein
MLLLSVKLVGGGWVVEVGEDGAVDLAGHIAFKQRMISRLDSPWAVRRAT